MIDCQVNHNSNYSLFVDGADIAITYTGCQFFDDTIKFVNNTNGLIFTGCEDGTCRHVSEQTLNIPSIIARIWTVEYYTNILKEEIANESYLIIITDTDFNNHPSITISLNESFPYKRRITRTNKFSTIFRVPEYDF